MTARRVPFGLALVGAAALGCGGPAVPAEPTWADVRPIVAGECTGCHGATASSTGAGYRFDFYDMTEASCGSAAVQALGANTPLASAHAMSIWEDISAPPDEPSKRPKMPPPPAPYLADWQWQTIKAWVEGGAAKGDTPAGNRPPELRFFGAAASGSVDSGSTATVDRSLDLTALVDDLDGDPVAGVLLIGDAVLKMDRSGSFSATLDTSSWPEGDVPVVAKLCDGWTNTSSTLGMVTVRHTP